MLHALHHAWNAARTAGPSRSVWTWAILAILLSHGLSHAQRATFDQERSYYDLGLFDLGASGVEYADFASASTYSPSPAGDPVGSYVAYVGNYGGTINDSDQSSFYRLTDDVNSNGTFGSVVVVQIGPDGDPVLTTLTDFGDLHQFNVAFDFVGVARQSSARSYDAAAVYWIYEEGTMRPDPERVAAQRAQHSLKHLRTPNSKTQRGTGAKPLFSTLPIRSQMMPAYSKYAMNRQGTGIGLNYGYYEFGMFDRFRFDADGGILGRTISDTRTNNWVTGPQAGLVAYKSFGPLRFYGHALGVLGLNDGDLQQNNSIGNELVPGAVNRLLYAQPTHVENRGAVDDISPTGVFWAEAGLQVTERTSVRFAWSGVYVNNILLAEDRVRYYLPSMGFRTTGEQDFLQQFFYCGVEMTR
jgi:hypothetical protein